MAVKKEITRSGWLEVAGILSATMGLLVLLALLSYDPRDVSVLQFPPSDPPVNFIGPMGAWTAFLAFMGLGVAGYLVPFTLFYCGLICLFKREGRLWTKVVWAVVVLLSIASLLDLNAGGWAEWRSRLNVGSPGGLLGELLTTRSLVYLWGPIGTGILMTALLVIGLIMMLEVRPGVLLRSAWGLVLSGYDRWEVARKARLDRLRQLEEEQREVAKKRRRLEEAMRAPEQQPSVRVRRKQPEVEPAPIEAPAERAASRASAEDELSDAVRTESLPAPEEAIAEGEKKGFRLFGRKAREQDVETEADLANADALEADAEAEVDAPPASPPRTRARAVSPATQPSPAEHQAVLPSSGANWKLPGLDLLEPVTTRPELGTLDIQAEGLLLKETLAEFGVEVEVTNIERGPVVTRYELLPAAGVRVERIAGLSNNIALAMKAETVRVQAPIPGKGVVGIEVPNSKTTAVYLREVVESEVWQSGRAALPLCLGKDVGGRVQVADLADMPHMLVAGATGSGKTVCMNSILAGLLLSRSPDQMRLMLVDPKIVEFSNFNSLPHLVVPVITDPKKVALGLRWAITEMEKRYKLFAKVGVRNIKAFNSRPIAKQEELFAEEIPTAPAPVEDAIPDRVPYIVIVVDELADLMMVAQAEVESQIARLAQLSRAVGIHMILATQRPSVNVITGTIKANFPARISFQVAQKVDSRTILDAAGADKLLGKGDMLFLPPGSPKLIRAQGAFTKDAEINGIIEFWKKQGVPQYESAIKDKIEGKQVDLPDMEEDDEMLQQALEIIRQTRRASTSSLQRRLRIGYTRAARIMDMLEQKGVVGPAQGADPREILIDLDGEVPQNESENEV
ncbi:MAG: DNA translocase FtsK [Kiritimatiellae bacterium]|nr:DNA translocase FtsK [Kiritimatiellia bacterium]MCO5069412.1 DNA translocase FtsK [Kiritimatiellia bacterium]